MKHMDKDGIDRHPDNLRDMREHRRNHRHHHGHEGRGRRRRHGRMFDYGELRLLVLALLSEQPRHGYDLMREIEERTRGGYNPSPGVIYPTLQWLEDMGYARLSAEGGGRKEYLLTREGASFIVANQTALDSLLARMGAAAADGPGEGIPERITRAMENLKVAMRLRLRRSPLDENAAETISAALDTAALAVEKS